jgi:hypothetical protein
MPEAKKNNARLASDIGLDGFEQIFDDSVEADVIASATRVATTTNVSTNQDQVEKLLTRLTEIIAFSVDQRMENARMAEQLIENQRQLIATQQILIRLMEKSIELTKHISAIEEKLPAIFELPKLVHGLQDRLVQMEGVELY